ncbi:serine threonine-protein kinase smg1-like protein [Nannochloropsis gaditana]|uniref:Serine threonine-protein kinase smg1-like protein n=1 Tax=Nannochloropsis gaditana TaxID=72520 RepID=W7TMR5_9STRA|nr:serine threonine-protein kinase smg1-like protein [Nannochloropsis gaditana]
MSSSLTLWREKLAFESPSLPLPLTPVAPSVSQTLWARTLGELALRGSGEDEEPCGQGDSGVFDLYAWLASEVEGGRCHGQPKGHGEEVLLLNLSALSAAVAVACPRRIEERVEGKGEGGRPLAKAQARAEAAGCRALQALGFLPSGPDPPVHDQASRSLPAPSPALQAAAMDLASRLLRTLPSSRTVDLLPHLLEQAVPAALAPLRSPSSPAAGTSPATRVLRAIDLALGDLLKAASCTGSGPFSGTCLSRAVATRLLQGALGMLARSSPFADFTPLVDEELEGSDEVGVALGKHRGLALSLIGKILRLLPPPARTLAHSPSPSSSSDSDHYEAQSTLLLLQEARTLLVHALRDPIPAIRPRALQTLALFRLLVDDHCLQYAPSCGSEAVGDVLLLQVEPVASACSPFQRTPEFVRRLFDYLIGVGGEHPEADSEVAQGREQGKAQRARQTRSASSEALSRAQKRGGGDTGVAKVGMAGSGKGGEGGGDPADDEPFFQWLRSLCLDAMTGVLRIPSFADTAAGEASHSLAVSLLETCLGQADDGVLKSSWRGDNVAIWGNFPSPSSLSKQVQRPEHPMNRAARRLRAQAGRSLRSPALWAVWELARLLVWGRLKTHVGGPGATFATLERAMAKIQIELMQDKKKDGALLRRADLLVTFLGAFERHIANVVEGSEGRDVGSQYLARKMQGHVTNIEIDRGDGEGSQASERYGNCARDVPCQVQEAKPVGGAERTQPGGQCEYPSSVRIALPPPSKKTEAFFLANKRVCWDWLARVRPMLVRVSLSLEGCQEQGVEYAFKRLVDLASVAKQRGPKSSSITVPSPSVPLSVSPVSFQDVEELAVEVAVAVTEHFKESGVEMLQGLERWLAALQRSNSCPSLSASSTALALPTSLVWLQGLQLMAQGRYEDALRRWIGGVFFHEGFNTLLTAFTSSSLSQSQVSQAKDMKRSIVVTASVKAQASLTAWLLLQQAQTPAVLQTIMDRSVLCYCRLGDWRGLGVFLQAVQALHVVLSAMVGEEIEAEGVLSAMQGCGCNADRMKGGGSDDREGKKWKRVIEKRGRLQEGEEAFLEDDREERDAVEKAGKIPSWVLSALVPRVESAWIQTWMRVDGQGCSLLFAQAQWGEKGLGAYETVNLGESSTRKATICKDGTPSLPTSTRRPNLSAQGWMEVFSFLQQHRQSSSGFSRYPSPPNLASEMALATCLDETLELLMDESHHNHADALRAIATQTPRLLEGLTAPLAVPSALPSAFNSLSYTLYANSGHLSSPLLTDIACLSTFSSVLRREGEDGSEIISSRRPPTAFSWLLSSPHAVTSSSDLSSSPSYSFVFPSSTVAEDCRCDNVSGDSWLHLHRTALVLKAVTRLHEQGLSAGSSAHSMSQTRVEDTSYDLSLDLARIRTAWLHAARRERNVGLCKELIQELESPTSSSLSPSSLDWFLRVRYEEVQVNFLETNGIHQLGACIASLLVIASALLLSEPGLASVSSTRDPLAPSPLVQLEGWEGSGTRMGKSGCSTDWLRLAKDSELSGLAKLLCSGEETRDRGKTEKMRRHWGYRCLVRASQWLQQYHDQHRYASQSARFPFPGPSSALQQRTNKPWPAPAFEATCSSNTAPYALPSDTPSESVFAYDPPETQQPAPVRSHSLCDSSPPWFYALFFTHANSNAEELAGRCLELAAQVVSPKSRQWGKAWRLWGDWLYRRAKALSTNQTTHDNARNPQQLERQKQIQLNAWKTHQNSMPDLVQLSEELIKHENPEGNPSRARREAVQTLLMETILSEEREEDGLGEEGVLSVSAVKKAGCERGGNNAALIARLREAIRRLRRERREARVQALEGSVDAYCRYLQVGEKSCTGLGDSGYSALRALSALRILKMLARLPSAALQPSALMGTQLEPSTCCSSLLRRSLTAMPLNPWQALVPQLLIRLAILPEASFQSLLPLFERLVASAPQEIAWTLTVGCAELERSRTSQSFALSPISVSTPVHKQTKDMAVSVARARWLFLKSFLQERHPDLIQDVAVFTEALTSLGQLWDERWLVYVSERWHVKGLQGRLRSLSREGERLARNPTLPESEKGRIVCERYAAMLLPLFVEAQTLAGETGCGMVDDKDGHQDFSGSPDASSSAHPSALEVHSSSPHNCAFAKKWRPRVMEVLALLQCAPDTAAAMDPMSHVWPVLEKFKRDIITAVAGEEGRSRKKSGTDVEPGPTTQHQGRQLRAEAVTPQLLSLLAKGNLQHVEMPGTTRPTFFDESQGRGVAVQMVGIGGHGIITVLKTKTRPKKLSLLGSDGREYTYLLKGRDDLRLDERLMQLLVTVNSVLHVRAQTPRTEKCALGSAVLRGLRARHYAVLPLSASAGLVQWVGGTTPLFSLYKSWRLRAVRGERLLLESQQQIQQAIHQREKQQQQQVVQAQEEDSSIDIEKRGKRKKTTAERRERRKRQQDRERRRRLGEKGVEREISTERARKPLLWAPSATFEELEKGARRQKGRAAKTKKDSSTSGGSGTLPEPSVEDKSDNVKTSSRECSFHVSESRGNRGQHRVEEKEEEARDDEDENEEEDDLESAPAALFYAELVPELARQGLDLRSTAASHRGEWPHSVLRTVYDRLVAQSPRHLLEVELVAGSLGAEDLWQRRQVLARSLAVMSVLGAVLGLGDRHLNNLLWDGRRAELLHIDYTVCFDRGLRLRVPEVVPFRLTPVLVAALGPLGVDSGAFVNGMETVLRGLRGHKKLLLSVLETLAHDPLVNWEDILGVRGNGGGGRGHQGPKQLHQHALDAIVTLKLVALRVGETRTLLRDRVLQIKKGFAALQALLDRVRNAREGWVAEENEIFRSRPVLRDSKLLVEGTMLGQKRADLAGRLVSLQLQAEDQGRSALVLDASRRDLDKALHKAAAQLKRRWEYQVWAVQQVLWKGQDRAMDGKEGKGLGREVDGVRLRSEDGRLVEKVSSSLRNNIQRILLPANGSAKGAVYELERDEGDPFSIAPGLLGRGLQPQYCLLSRGASSLLPPPVGEEECAYHDQFIEACRSEDARLGKYLRVLETALERVLEPMRAYSSLVRDTLSIEPDEYVGRSLTRRWLRVVGAQQERMRLLITFSSTMESSAAADSGGGDGGILSCGPSIAGWAMVEAGPEEALEEVWPAWQRPRAGMKANEERLRRAEADTAWADNLQAALRVAVERREALVSEESCHRESEGRGTSFDARKRREQQDKDLEAAKDRLKVAVRALCKASNLAPISEGKRNHARLHQVYEQRAMHRFLLERVVSPLDSTWGWMRSLENFEVEVASTPSNGVVDRRAGLVKEIQRRLSHLEVLVKEVLVPGIGRVEEEIKRGNTGERLTALRTETLATLRRVYSLAERNEIQALVGALSRQERGGENCTAQGQVIGKENEHGSSFAEVTADAKLLYEAWQRGKEMVLDAVGKRAQQLVESELVGDADSLAASFSSLSLIDTLSLPASTRDAWTAWRKQVEDLEAACKALLASPSVSTLPLRRLGMFVEGIFDRLEKADFWSQALRPPPFSAAARSDFVGEGVQGVPEYWPWLGEGTATSMLQLERILTTSQVMTVWMHQEESSGESGERGEIDSSHARTQGGRTEWRVAALDRLLADSMQRLLSITVGVPVRLATRSLVDRVMRVLGVSAPDLLERVASTREVQQVAAPHLVEVSPRARWKSLIGAFDAYASSQATTAATQDVDSASAPYSAACQALATVSELVQSLAVQEASSLAAAEAMRKAEEMESTLARSLTRLEWDLDGDFQVLAAAKSVGVTVLGAEGLLASSAIYVPHTPPSQRRSFLLQCLAGAVVTLAQVLSVERSDLWDQAEEERGEEKAPASFLAPSTKGSDNVSPPSFVPSFLSNARPASRDESSRHLDAWLKRKQDLMRLARGNKGSTNSGGRSLSSDEALVEWDSKTKALVSCVEAASTGARAILLAAEGVLDFERSRVDMRGVEPGTDSQDAALWALVSQHQGALAPVIEKRKAQAGCLREMGRAKADMAVLEREANAVDRRMVEMGERRRAWMEEEHVIQADVRTSLRRLAAELRDCPSSCLSSPPTHPEPPPLPSAQEPSSRTWSSSTGSAGARLLDVGMLKSIVRATQASTSTASREASVLLRRVHEDALFLLRSTQALEAEAGALAFLLESSCIAPGDGQKDESGRGGSSNQQGPPVDELTGPEAWATALESLLEGVESMGGEDHVLGLAGKFGACLEELEDLAEDANDAAKVAVAKNGEGSETEDSVSEPEEEEEDKEIGGKGQEKIDKMGCDRRNEELRTGEHLPMYDVPDTEREHPSPAALGALRKVQAKIEGRSVGNNADDPRKALEIRQQVDKWIREATDPDRLCVLFEGWMPFV